MLKGKLHYLCQYSFFHDFNLKFSIPKNLCSILTDVINLGTKKKL